MKTYKLLFVTIAVFAMSFDQPFSGLTDAERKYAENLLQETKKNLIDKVSSLTQEQLNYKPEPGTWSVAECVEQIAISEDNIFGLVKIGLKDPADPSKRSEVKMTDEAIVKMIADRSNKVKTKEAFEPTGRFGSFEATLAEFKKQRDKNIQYVKTTADDLRNHYNDFPFGKIDTYQTILFMAAHTRRHTEQIAEVMKNPGFPGNGK